MLPAGVHLPEGWGLQSRGEAGVRAALTHKGLCRYMRGRGSQVNHAPQSKEDRLWFPTGRKEGLQLLCSDEMHNLCSGSRTSHTTYLDDTKHMHRPHRRLPADGDLAEGKRQEGNAFAFVFSCLWVQVLSCKESMLPVQQVWIGHFKDIAKTLEKNDLPKP